MKNTPIESLTEEIKDLKTIIEELTDQVRQLQLKSKAKVPGAYQIGDRVIVLTSGRIGKTGDVAKVTKVGKRISIIVRDQHTNRHPSNLKHV
jgi:ABC-type uncharacterized transport system ATPase subunit